MSLVSLFNATGGFSWAFNVVRDASLSPSLCEAQPRWIHGSCSADQFTDQITGMARWGSMHQRGTLERGPINPANNIISDTGSLSHSLVDCAVVRTQV